MSIIYCDEHWSPYKVKAHLCFFLNVSSRSIQRMLLFKTKLFIIFTFTTKSRNLKRDVSMMTGSRSGDLKKRKFIPFYPFTSFQSSSFVLYVCPSIHPSVRMELLGFHWMGFHEIWYLSIFGKSTDKIKDVLKSDKNNGYFTGRQINIFY